AYVRMERFASGAALEPRVDLLVRQLAAELAGCRWCIEHGVHRWRGSFLPVAELGALRRHAASPLFSPRERAALAFTEAVTRYAEGAGGIPESVLAELRCHFSEQEVAALTQAAAGEHFFNAATGALGADAQLGPAGTAGGSLPGRRRAVGLPGGVRGRPLGQTNRGAVPSSARRRVRGAGAGGGGSGTGGRWGARVVRRSGATRAPARGDRGARSLRGRRAPCRGGSN